MELDTQRVVSRKQFFRLGLAAIADKIAQWSPIPLDLDDRPDPAATLPLRPPGAVPEPEFLQRCTGCEECVKACPHWAIGMMRDERGSVAGTPVIDPRRTPCYWCRDFPCIAACPEGALRFDDALIPMGKAHILREACLAWAGNRCQSCVTNCPVGTEAIDWNANGLPVINPENCTGCGVCLYVCPAEPAAIDVLPAAKARLQSP